MAVVVAADHRRNQRRALTAWRQRSGGLVDAAHVARTLLPATGEDEGEPEHWHQVRREAERVADLLLTASGEAPGRDTATAMQSTADALRGLTFAIEAERLLRDGSRAPTADQLAGAEAATRARSADLDRALQQLDIYLPTSPGDVPEQPVHED